MTEHLEKIAHASLGAFKTLALTGPVAVTMGGAGGVLFGLALFTGVNDHADAILGLAAMLITLAYVEWALLRRLSAHERIERQDKEDLVAKMLKANEANLNTVLLQVGAIGAEHDSILRKLRDIQEQLREQGPKVIVLENALHRLEEAVTELERWRSRIGDRLGTLR